MLGLSYQASIGPLLEGMGIGLDALSVVQTDTGPMVFAASGPEGGVVCIAFDAQGTPQIIDQRYFDPGIQGAVDGRLDVVETPDGPVLLVGAAGSDALVGFEIDPGALGATTQLSGTLAAAADNSLLVQTGNGFVFAAAADGALRCFAINGAGGLDAGQVLFDTQGTFFATPTAMASLTINGQTFLLTACADTPGVSAFAVNDQTGQLNPTASLGVETGLGLYETPVEMVTTSVAGRHYVLVASASESSQGAALSVMEITESGALVVTDHILDSLETRFGKVSGLSVVEHEGWSYVVAAGGDGGVSLFALMPGGQLVLMETVVSQADAPLASLTDISASVAADQMTILTTSHQTQQIAGLSADLSDQGDVLVADWANATLTGGALRDMLVGDTADNTLVGGAGDDILRDGAGADVMTGGAGADRFVIESDSALDVITDFSWAQDTLDLSLIPFLYSASQVSVASAAWGALVTYRGQQLELRSDTGTMLTAAQVISTIDWGMDRPPLIIRVELRGTNNDDTLEGRDGDDLINGQRGADLIYGYDGFDIIDGGRMDDTIYAGAGADTVYGGQDNDLVYLDDGDDIFLDGDQAGPDQSDTVFGGNGNDTIISIAGGDELHGGAGNDSLVGGFENDTIYGGTSFDTIEAAAGDDMVWGGDGRDLVFLGDGDDLFTDNSQGGEFGRDTVFAGDGNDVIEGGNGDDEFHGENGNDRINARLGNDSVYGGSGGDTLFGGDGADSIWGGDGRDLIFLNQGNDVFTDSAQGGESGRDTVFGGFGNDTFFGGGGNDQFHGEWGADLLYGDLGDDTIYAGSENDTVYGGEGNDEAWGGDGRDLIYLGAGDDLFVDNAQGGFEGRDTVWAGAGADTIEGGNGDDVFYGEDGHDLIYARLGNDSVFGGAGDDTLYGAEGDDTIWGGDGRDLAYLGDGNDLFWDTEETAPLGNDSVFGGAGNDTITGNAGNNEFHGENGDDVLTAGVGNDSLYGGNNADELRAGAGDDVVFGGFGRDEIFLEAGDDRFVDTVQAGTFGQDTITGGAGADTFVFAGAMSRDVIRDFDRAEDELHLSQELWAGTLTAAQVVAQYGDLRSEGVVLDFGEGNLIVLEGLTSTFGLADSVLLY
ncbi:hypothetical protein ACS3SW_20935 [Roseobacteraceae bacterium S113]